MKKAVPMILSEDNFKQIFAFADRNSRLAKLLYNAALFRIRQVLIWRSLSLQRSSVQKRPIKISPAAASFLTRH